MGRLPLPVFDDGKAPDALRTIGEVAKAFNLRQHVLRYWEEQFPMLRPLTRAGGRRYYRTEDIALIAEICRLLYQEGFTIRGARQALTGYKGGDGADPTEVVAQDADDHPQAVGEEKNRSDCSTPSRASSPAGAPDGELLDRLLALRGHLAQALNA